jgi:tetratricopeptide (TPR) repeat protein
LLSVEIRFACGDSKFAFTEIHPVFEVHELSTDTFVNARVSFLQRAGLWGLMAIAGFMGNLRLNDCDLFNPDSPRYVLYSKSIVDLGEYRATDLPGSPLYAWRPPGLSLLLAPVMTIWPYDVIAAKAVILVTGILLLWMVFHMAALHGGGWMALMVTGAVASNPSFYVMSTEVLTEVPYTLGVLVVLFILSRSTFFPSDSLPAGQRWSWRLSLALAIVALSLTPWLRTAGISLVLAVGLWTMMSRARLQWIPCFSIAVCAFGLLAWRNKLAGGENYVGSLFTRIHNQGIRPVFASGVETIEQYLYALPGLLLPGITTERPWFSPVTPEGLPTIALPYVMGAVLGALVVSLSLIGMCRCRARGGSLALLYLLIYCACLVVWPWRHERFVWPLIPILMSYLPAGISTCSAFVPMIGSYVSSVGTILILSLVCWQSLGCHALASVNQEFMRDRETFYTRRLPGFYFNNWRRAGEWLNAHTTPSTRVLTWSASVAGTSHRFQKRALFETLSPEKLRQQIEAFSARYLIVSDAQFGDGFGWQQLAADPAICLKIVYREENVVVLEVIPNRAGTVSKDAYPNWVNEQLLQVNEVLERQPQRSDLAVRQASLLREIGRTDDAIRVLRKLWMDGVRTVRVCSELGWMYYDSEDYAQAIEFLALARTLPNAESIANLLSESIVQAKERIKEAAISGQELSIERRLNRVKLLMSTLKYDAAERELDRIEAAFPENREIVFFRGKLWYRLGEDHLAEKCFEKAMNSGHSDAQQWLLEMRFARAMASEGVTIVTAGNQQETVDPADPRTHLRAAEYLAHRGWTGRSLAALEIAFTRFPRDPSILTSLAEAYLRFSRPELAVPLYESVLDHDPSNEAVKKRLEKARHGLLEPAMFPL